MLRNSLLKDKRNLRKSRKSLKSRKSRKLKKEKTKKIPKTKTSNKRAVRRASPQKTDLKDGYYNATVVINDEVSKFKSPLYINHEGKQIGYIYNLVAATHGYQSYYPQQMQAMHTMP